MKANVNVKFLKLQEGVSKKGKKWAYLMVQDEDFTNFNIFVTNAEKIDEYKKLKMDEIINLEVKIGKEYNQKLGQFETTVKVDNNE